MTSTTLTPTPTIDERIAKLQAAFTAIPDALDLPRSLSQREVDGIEERRATLRKRVQAAITNRGVLSELDPQIATLSKQQTDLNEIRADAGPKLLALPAYSRDRVVQAQRRSYELTIKAIDGYISVMDAAIPEDFLLFTALRDRGYVAPDHAPWNVFAALHGSLPTIEHRLLTLQKQRSDAQAILDGVLNDPI